MTDPIFTTPNLDIIDLPADSRHTSGPRSAAMIKYIILHTTEGSDSRRWLSTDPNSNVSAHRLIQRTPFTPSSGYGGHYKLVQDLTIANHAGYGTIGDYGPGQRVNLNTVSLGIEIERYGSQVPTAYQYEQTAAIVLEWWGRYTFPQVILHRDVDPTRRTDPVNFDMTRFWTLVYSRLRSLP